MLISLHWIRDFVDLPREMDPRALAERFTRVTAEVDAVTEVHVGANGLIAALVRTVRAVADAPNLREVVLDVGGGRTATVVSAAPNLSIGLGVVLAPVGARTRETGEIRASKVAGRTSEGLILPGSAIGIELAQQEAVLLDRSVHPGTRLDAALFDDWLIEVDNKSITHRPDLWGHYGVAREIAAIVGAPLKAYPVVPISELASSALEPVSIAIADARACRRYCGIVLGGVPTQPAPLWMQLRLGRVGMRPISGLVDLTNYVMADLGQPMHAFDAAKVRRIEVDGASPEARFRTLDGVDRSLTRETLMIRCEGHDVALAGVMGGLETEVTESTRTLLLESANFDPATVRRTAARLGLRTEASARFEKGLDPAYAQLGIQRFMHFARMMYAELRLVSRFSDAHPRPLEPVEVRVSPRHVARAFGRAVSFVEAERVLAPLGFELREGADEWRVGVPSHRATHDVTTEVDVIEEVMRRIGYDTIAPAMPRVTMRRFEPNPVHALEHRSVDYFTSVHGFHEIHDYIWYDSTWLRKLEYDPGPCVELRNPAAASMQRLRRSLMPGLLAALDKNRFHFASLALLEVGSVFETNPAEDREFRHLGLVLAERGKHVEETLYSRMKGAIEGWSWTRVGHRATTQQANVPELRPWEAGNRTAAIVLDGSCVGDVGLVNVSLRRRMDEHLGAWGIAWAEIRLDQVATRAPLVEAISAIPPYPVVELDFSFLVPRTSRYSDLAGKLTAFTHPLLQRIRYVGSYEDDSAGDRKRSLTVRAVVGDLQRTLTETDVSGFRSEFERFLRSAGVEIRQ